jgi:integrase
MTRATTIDHEQRARANAKGITAALVVRVTKDGSPRWAAKWRDSTGRQMLRNVGPAWLVRRPALANPFEDGSEGRTGAEEPRGSSWRSLWEPRRGRPKDDALDERGAHARASHLIVVREMEILHEAESAVAPEHVRPVLFAAVAADWLAERQRDVADGSLKPSSLADYRSMLRAPDAVAKTRGRTVKGGETGAWILSELGHLPITEITAETVESFERKLQAAKRSPRTRTKYRTVVSMVLDHARYAGHVERNVVADVPRKRRPRPQDKGITTYDIGTVEQIAAEIPDRQIAEIVRTLALTGLRIGEALGLRWADVSFSRRSITVRRTYVPGTGENSPKGGKLRTVPLSDQAAVVLDRVSRREDWTRSGDLVFGRTDGNKRKGREYQWLHVDPATVRRAYGKARDAVIAEAVANGEQPIEALRVHDLRHAYGSTLAAAGVPISTLQAWMGHANIATTMVYVHFQPQSDDADRLTKAFGGVVGEVAEASSAAV